MRGRGGGDNGRKGEEMKGEEGERGRHVREKHPAHCPHGAFSEGVKFAIPVCAPRCVGLSACVYFGLILPGRLSDWTKEIDTEIVRLIMEPTYE